VTAKANPVIPAPRPCQRENKDDTCMNTFPMVDSAHYARSKIRPRRYLAVAIGKKKKICPSLSAERQHLTIEGVRAHGR
jgi:hypothetical protein